MSKKVTSSGSAEKERIEEESEEEKAEKKVKEQEERKVREEEDKRREELIEDLESGVKFIGQQGSYYLNKIPVNKAPYNIC